MTRDANPTAKLATRRDKRAGKALIAAMQASPHRDLEIVLTRKPPKRGLPPMHPGELLREEILPALDRSKTEIARLLGVSRQTLYDVLKEKQPVTPGMALRLGKLCGNGPDLWLNLQKRYDLHQAERELGEKIKDIPTLEVA